MQYPEIKRLGAYLVEAGLITEAQVDVALSDQEYMDDMRMGDILVTRGWVKQQTLDYLITKVVDPEQQLARQSVLEDSLVRRHAIPHSIYEIVDRETQPEMPRPTAQPPIAQAVSLDGDTIIEIVSPRATALPANDPKTINDRKSLPTNLNEADDGLNWVG
jgi:hypothetical protein